MFTIESSGGDGAGGGLRGGGTEQFVEFDITSISSQLVPTPGAACVLAVAGLLAGTRRRR